MAHDAHHHRFITAGCRTATEPGIHAAAQQQAAYSSCRRVEAMYAGFRPAKCRTRNHSRMPHRYGGAASLRRPLRISCLRCANPRCWPYRSLALAGCDQLNDQDQQAGARCWAATAPVAARPAVRWKIATRQSTCRNEVYAGWKDMNDYMKAQKPTKRYAAAGRAETGGRRRGRRRQGRGRRQGGKNYQSQERRKPAEASRVRKPAHRDDEMNGRRKASDCPASGVPTTYLPDAAWSRYSVVAGKMRPRRQLRCRTDASARQPGSRQLPPISCAAHRPSGSGG